MCSGSMCASVVTGVGGEGGWIKLYVCRSGTVAGASHPPAPPPAHMAVDSRSNHGSGAPAPEPH